MARSSRDRAEVFGKNTTTASEALTQPFVPPSGHSHRAMKSWLRPKIGYLSAMYSVLDYGHMANDSVRMAAYSRAIARSVKPGSIVVDIGAGTGILSLLAARAGARRVHAIEPNPAVWLIPELAAENGCAERIEIHPCTSFEVELPERADVIVSDLRGSVPLHGTHLATLRDAKERLLAPGGVLIPARDRLFVAGVEAWDVVALLQRGVQGFVSRGFSAQTATTSIFNTSVSDSMVRLNASDLVTTPMSWADIEYGAPTPPLEKALELTPRRSGIVHGLAIWFEATIADGIVFDNAPGMSLVYTRTFLPLLEPLSLEHGETLEVVLRADESGSRWAWDTRHRSASGHTKATLRQATFLGKPTSPEALLRASSSHMPSPSDAGERLRRILALMDGAHTIDEITDALRAGAPAAMPRATLLEEVRDAVDRYAR